MDITDDILFTRSVINDVVADPYVKTIPEFKPIYTRDKGKDKSRATKDFLYIYHLINYKSPYRAYTDEKTREEVIKRDVYGDKKYNIDKDIEAALKKYQELSDSETVKMLKRIQESLSSSHKVIGKLRDMIESEMQEEGSNLKNVVSNLKTIMEISNKIPETIETISSLEERVKKEEGEKRYRGSDNVEEFEL